MNGCTVGTKARKGGDRVGSGPAIGALRLGRAYHAPPVFFRCWAAHDQDPSPSRGVMLAASGTLPPIQQRWLPAELASDFNYLPDIDASAPEKRKNLELFDGRKRPQKEKPLGTLHLQGAGSLNGLSISIT